MMLSPCFSRCTWVSISEDDVGKIEISPFGLHWPTLDEDLSLEGILAGRYGHQ